MTEHSTEFSSPARYSFLPELMLWLDALARQLEIPQSDLLRIQLVLEELFSNSIDHGYGKECEETIGVALRSDTQGITLTYRDNAPPFDMGACTMSNPDADQVGGLGINLILGMTRALRYQRLADSNQLEIDF